MKDILSATSVGAIDGSFYFSNLSTYLNRERNVVQGEYGKYIQEIGYVTPEQLDHLNDFVFRGVEYDPSIIKFQKNDEPQSKDHKGKNIAEFYRDAVVGRKGSGKNTVLQEGDKYNHKAVASNSAAMAGVMGIYAKKDYLERKKELDDAFANKEISDKYYRMESDKNQVIFEATVKESRHFFDYNKKQMSQINDRFYNKSLDLIQSSNGQYSEKYVPSDFSNIGEVYYKYVNGLAEKYKDSEGTFGNSMINFTKQASAMHPSSIEDGELITEELPLDNYRDGKFMFSKDDVSNKEVQPVEVKPVDEEFNKTPGEEFLQTTEDLKNSIKDDVKDITDGSEEEEKRSIDNIVNPRENIEEDGVKGRQLDHGFESAWDDDDDDDEDEEEEDGSEQMVDQKPVDITVVEESVDSPQLDQDHYDYANYISNLISQGGGVYTIFNDSYIQYMKSMEYPMDGDFITGTPEWYNTSEETPEYKEAFDFARYIEDKLMRHGGALPLFSSDSIQYMQNNGYGINEDGIVSIPDWYNSSQVNASTIEMRDVFSDFEIDMILKRYGV
jgi:hypothetical protein